MRITKLKKANRLEQEIKELNYFLTVLAPKKQEESGGGFKRIQSHIKRIVNVSYSIFGVRCFGGGSHIQEINVPDSMIADLYELAEKRKIKLEQEFRELWVNNQTARK